jgi:hypothetical protein
MVHALTLTKSVTSLAAPQAPPNGPAATRQCIVDVGQLIRHSSNGQGELMHMHNVKQLVRTTPASVTWPNRSRRLFRQQSRLHARAHTVQLQRLFDTARRQSSLRGGFKGACVTGAPLMIPAVRLAVVIDT